MFKSIVTAVDGSAHARKAVDVASDLAAKYGARMTIIHVVGSGPVPAALAHMAEIEHLVKPKPGSSPENVSNVLGNLATIQAAEGSAEVGHHIHVALGEKILNDAASTARALGVEAVEVVLKDGEPVAEILNTATTANADLIVMGRRGLSELKGLLLGSVSHKISQLADCPCLTMK
jgi:nucleotide-binding universal stress UspA family protein